MKVIQTRDEMMQVVADLRLNGKSIGFVPTMGYLHAGHLSLVRRARVENDVVIVSIFVNPKQFGPHEDFAQYPCDLERDKKLMEPCTDYLFYPEVQEIYHADEKITFAFSGIDKIMCGIFRPHHFFGVALVLVKFFHIIQPQRVYLGQKDYQQTVVVRHLIEDLCFEILPVICPTVREPDGLALSSRNVYLSASERMKAPLLYQALQSGLHLLQAGEQKGEVITQKIHDFLYDHDITTIEYIDLRDVEDLSKIEFVSQKPVILALAVQIGKTRLIDNILFTLNVS